MSYDRQTERSSRRGIRFGSSSRPASSVGGLLNLQTTAGNRAVSQLVATSAKELPLAGQWAAGNRAVSRLVASSTAPVQRLALNDQWETYSGAGKKRRTAALREVDAAVAAYVKP